MKFYCPVCKTEVEQFSSRCPECLIPFSWLNKYPPGVDLYRLDREGDD